MHNHRPVDLETPAISALAAASKTPFATAFKVTLGIGLARFLMFTVSASVIIGTILVFNK